MRSYFFTFINLIFFNLKFCFSGSRPGREPVRGERPSAEPKEHSHAPEQTVLSQGSFFIFHLLDE
jgi:hypothetical protein